MGRTGPVVTVSEHALDLLDRGNTAPTVKQLLSCINGDRPKYWSGVKKLLQKVRYRIENILDRRVCPLSETYYCGLPPTADGKPTRPPFFKKPPRNEAEALLCLPGGKSGRVAGLYFPQDTDNDEIYLAFCAQGGHQGASHYALSVKRAHEGVADKILNGRKTKKRMETVGASAMLKKWSPLMEKIASSQVTVLQRLENIEKKLNKN